MKQPLAIIGVVALLLWTGLGALAWSSVARRVTLVSSEEERGSRAEQAAPILALTDELTALHEDVRALASAMGENLQVLSDGLQAHQDERAAAIELRLAALRDEVGSRAVPSSSPELGDLLRELGMLREALRVSAATGSAAQLASADVTDPVVGSASAPPETTVAETVEQVELAASAAQAPPSAAVAPLAPKRSFLAFKLPSDDFRFDERRTWTILPTLSRVGFDAKTTLHDFTATSSTLEGELEADLSRPDQTPHARVRVQAATLASGDDARDEAMHEHLAVATHATLEFELASFEATAIDLEKKNATGLAHGRMTLRGITHEVSMPVRLTLDEARRLCVDGEMPLDLTRFQVPVPNKLGLIRMEELVNVWISLRLRVNPRTEG